MAEILNTFWNEFKEFQKEIGAFGLKSRWNTPDATNRNANLQHKKYSLPYTKVLGYVAFIVTKKDWELNWLREHGRMSNKLSLVWHHIRELTESRNNLLSILQQELKKRGLKQWYQKMLLIINKLNGVKTTNCLILILKSLGSILRNLVNLLFQTGNFYVGQKLGRYHYLQLMILFQ